MGNGINSRHLREYVIRPSLEPLGLYSQAAEQLLLGTLASESELGQFLHQISGPALGIYQIEPATHTDIWGNYLIYNNKLAHQIGAILPASLSNPNDELLITDLRYATIIARLVYYRQREPLPKLNDFKAQAAYWKTYYNTPQGKGTEANYLSQLEKYNLC